MSGIFLAALAFISRVDVWTVSSLEDVFPDTSPPANATVSVQLYARPGERESFQVCIRADQNGLEDVQLDAGPLDNDIPAPAVHRVAYVTQTISSARAYLDRSVWPDPLLDPAPWPIPPNETRAYWVTYAVPASARPGAHRGSVTVRVGQRRTRRIPVNIEVFNAPIPARPSIGALFVLDRPAIKRFLGISGDLESWKPVYGALAGYRLSYSVGEWAPTTPALPGGMPEADLLKEHMAYAVTSAQMTLIDLSLGDKDSLLQTRPAPGAPDPLQIYLRDITGWLLPRGWQDRACWRAGAIPARAEWASLFEKLFRAKSANHALNVIASGGIHPFFDPVVDTWALPLSTLYAAGPGYTPHGLYLERLSITPAKSVRASSSGPAPHLGGADSGPLDAYDGSLLTVWRSGGAPGTRGPEWLEFVFDPPIQSDSIRIIWESGHETANVNVKTSFDGFVFSSARVSWKSVPGAGYAHSAVTEGALRVKKTLAGVRLEFGAPPDGGPIGIREIQFSSNGALSPNTRDPVNLWLELSDSAFPSPVIGACPAETRIIPWVCWGQGLSGVLGSKLNAWPESWRAAAEEQPFLWPDPGASTTLFYPKAGGLLPSIRIERLRDGLEDYEYLCEFGGALPPGMIGAGAMLDMVKPRFYAPAAPPAAVQDLAQPMLDARRLIGVTLLPEL